MPAGSTLVRYEDPLAARERDAIAGSATRPTWRLFAVRCADSRLRLFEVRRAHLEMFARTMEQEGRMRSTVARRLSTRCSFYRYCHVEGLLARDPAANVGESRMRAKRHRDPL